MRETATREDQAALTMKKFELNRDRPRDAPKRAWQRMLSGRRLDLLNPAEGDIEIEDIAHGLARVARWNGQTLGPHAFSVAQHSVLVEEIATLRDPDWPARWRLAALLHDAPEYVVGDLISPFKTAIGLDYKAFERKLQSAIYARFGVPAELPDEVQAEIKVCDRVSAYFEATRLAGFEAGEATAFFGEPEGISGDVLDTLLHPLTADEAHATFLGRFNILMKNL
jgi:5'-deoxynucleotidase YfbR-like HD superfamily hydrolase